MRLDRIQQDLDLSRLDCFYADVRIEEAATTEIGFKNGRLENFAPQESVGAFLRVYNHGRWFFKSTTELDRIPEAFAELIARSKGSGGSCSDLFAAVPRRHDEILLFAGRDPRKVPLPRKRALCESYLDVAAGVSQVKEFNVHYKDRYEKRAFLSSRGRSYVYDYADYGLFLRFQLREEQFLFRDGFRHWSQELSGLSGRQEDAKRFLQESLRHLKAPAVPPGRYPVVMNSEVVGVFTHESFGHKSEADFMVGDEKAREEWKVGSIVASGCVSIVDSGVDPGSSGYCPIDDEGVPASRTHLIRNGVLQGRLHSLQTAGQFGEKPGGNARAINFEFQPIVRMTNTYIEAGTKTEEELIAPIRNGIMVCDYRHGSGLSTFTIAPTRSYWIRDGKVAEPVRVAVISGNVFETLKKISGVSRNLSIHNSAFGGCGKDEQHPLRVADGGPMISVEEMQVG